MPPEPPTDDNGISEWERHKLRLTVLEGRRAAADGFMWQAPVLTLAVQAFLLRILATESDAVIATAIAAAGVLATITATLALFILHDREVGFGQRIEEEAEALGLGSLRRQRPPGRSDEHPLELAGYVVWTVVLVSFAIVDLVVLGAKQDPELALIVGGVLVLAGGVASAGSAMSRERVAPPPVGPDQAAKRSSVS